MAVTIGTDHIVTGDTYADGFKIINPGGGRWAWTADSTPTGQIKIVFPLGPGDVNTNDNEWFQMKVTVGSPYLGIIRTLYLSGNLTDSTFIMSIDQHYMIDGTMDYQAVPVYSATTSSNYEIYIDLDNYDFNPGRNPICHIDEIWVNPISSLLSEWATGWSISNSSSMPTQKYQAFTPNQWTDLGSQTVKRMKCHTWDTYQLISTSTSGGYYTCTDSSFTYLTKKSSGYLLVTVMPNLYTNAHYGGLALFVNGSITNASSAGGNRNIVHAGVPVINYQASPRPFTVKIYFQGDSFTFDVRVQNKYNNAGFIWNRAGYHTGDPNATYNVSGISSITVQEVSLN